jgi:hypothetical protein
MDDQIEALSRKIATVTIDAGADGDVVFSALQHVFTFWMSRVCPACRRNVARKLKSDVPAMLNRANYAQQSCRTRRSATDAAGE